MLVHRFLTVTSSLVLATLLTPARYAADGEPSPPAAENDAADGGAASAKPEVSAVESRFRGSLLLDGERAEFDTVEGFREALRRHGLGDFRLDLDAFAPGLPRGGAAGRPGGSVARSEVFSGSLGVGGKSYTFDRREDFEAAREALIGGSPDLEKLLEKGRQGDGSAKAFRGSINVNGQRQDFDDEEAYREALERHGLGGQLGRAWERLGPGAQRSRSEVFSGSLGVGGKSYTFDRREDFEAARKALREGSADLEKLLEKGRPGDGSSKAFRGSINVNGQRQEFDDEEAYREALKERGLGGQLGQPWARLGPGAERSRSEAFSGSLGVGGKSYTFDRREDFEAARKALREGSADLEKLLEKGRPGGGSSVFRGTLNVGGKTLDFDDLESYRRALRKHGIGDVRLEVESRSRNGSTPPQGGQEAGDASGSRS